ncbi:MAG: BamA/TamA family outer membrane protein [Bacteroidota bacterium]
MSNSKVPFLFKKRSCKFKKFIFIPLILIIGFSSCKTTKHVPKDKYLLKGYDIELEKDDADIDKNELKSYIKQKPNRKFLGLKFPLFIYSLSREDKEGGLSKVFENMGEEPVVWDKYMTEEAKKQIRYFLENKGYYNSVVEDTVFLDNQKAKVKYMIDLNEPYIINNVSYDVRDSLLKPYIYEDTTNRLIRQGEIFSVEKMEQERKRIERLLRNKGFYNFSENFVSYVADTTSADNKVDLNLRISKSSIKNEEGEVKKVSHKRYKINNIYVFPEYESRQTIEGQQGYMKNLDTTYFDGLNFIYDDDPGIDLKTLAQANYIFPGEWYKQEDLDRTYEHLNSLRIFKSINIKFNETEKDSVNKLNCYIYLKKLELQSYTIELEGTNSSGNLGGGGNLLYSHKSLLNGAENFQTKFTGAFEILDPEKFNRLDNTIKLGTEVSLDVPKFIIPFFKSEQFVKKYHPRTSFSAMYNYQERPDYTRTLANLSFGYKWETSSKLSYFVNPFELNVLRLPYISSDFFSDIRDSYLRFSYDDHFLSLTSFNMIYNNQSEKKGKDFQYFRLNSELGGNILTAANEIANSTKVDGDYQLFGIRYAQFAKLDLDFRYYDVINESNRLVYRVFMGGGFPYGNSNVLPFVKQYFSGGANSIRAWNVRSLGPGSYSTENERGYPNQTADLKFEANMEYRFNMFWLLEGGLFVDVGNIWYLEQGGDIPDETIFYPERFFDDLAIGTGLGLRFDLSFSILRLDLGLKMRDPSFPEGKKWLPGNRNISARTLSWNIAIGYPF